MKLLDFGLARRIDPDSSGDESYTRLGTRSVRLAGTVPYMAPELLSGNQSDARSDLWAIGVMLCEMATGRRPFRGTTPWTMASEILHRRPTPSLPADAPAAFRDVVARCLQKDPARRFQNAAELATALAAIAADPAAAPGVSAVARKGRSARRRIRSIAVLPMDDLSPAPGQEHIAEGIVDALIATLSRIEALRVVSRTSVMRYKSSPQPLPEIARELDVDAVVEGSVIREGARLRVTARLIHAPTDTHVWSETYDRELRDILTLQTELAWAIVDGIQLKLSKRDSARLSEAHPVDSAAYDAHLRGRYHWNRRTGDDLRKAVAAFRTAIEKDPTCAPAYIGIADCHLTSVSYGLVPPRQAMPEMKAMVVKALALDNALPEAHLACAMVTFLYDWDWVAAERSLTHALALNPRAAMAHQWYALYLAAMGRVAEAARAVARACELEPLSPAIGALAGWALHFARQPEAAADFCLATLELDPSFFMAHMFLGLAREAQGRYADALAAVERAVRASGADRVGRTVLARLHARVGGRHARPIDPRGGHRRGALAIPVCPRGRGRPRCAPRDRSGVRMARTRVRGARAAHGFSECRSHIRRCARAAAVRIALRAAWLSRCVTTAAGLCLSMEPSRIRSELLRHTDAQWGSDVLTEGRRARETRALVQAECC